MRQDYTFQLFLILICLVFPMPNSFAAPAAPICGDIDDRELDYSLGGLAIPVEKVAYFFLVRAYMKTLDADTQEVLRASFYERIPWEEALTQHIDTYYGDSPREHRAQIRDNIEQVLNPIFDSYDAAICFEQVEYGPEAFYWYNSDYVTRKNVADEDKQKRRERFDQFYRSHIESGVPPIRATLMAASDSSLQLDNERGVNPSVARSVPCSPPKATFSRHRVIVASWDQVFREYEFKRQFGDFPQLWSIPVESYPFWRDNVITILSDHPHLVEGKVENLDWFNDTKSFDPNAKCSLDRK